MKFWDMFTAIFMAIGMSLAIGLTLNEIGYPFIGIMAGMVTAAVTFVFSLIFINTSDE